MFTINDVPKLGTTVQIKHDGLEDWVTIKVLSEPIQRPDGWGVRVEYVDIPEWLSSDDVTNDNTNYQWNLHEAQIKPVPLTNEQVLKTFLKKHRTLTKYRHNTRHYGLRDSTSTQNNTHISTSIGEAFYWHRTNEGSLYWSDIDKEWEKLVDHFKLKGTVDITKL